MSTTVSGTTDSGARRDRAGRTIGGLRSAVAAALPMLVVGTVAVLLWQLLVSVTGVQSFILPSPSSIATALASALWC
jgi:ABC-type nitrate/sulfonate/bicarbonate transport system permease component